jgi:FkbM family methyltransferase
MTWLDIALMIGSPNRRWPTDKLAVPRGEQNEGAMSTPIGTIYWDTSNRQHLGLLVFEELSAIYQRGRAHICEGDIVLDLGAHVGTFTRFALNRGAAKVIAVEPEPSHIAFLKRTFDLELMSGRVCLIEAAVWREEGSTRFRSEGVASRVTEVGPVSVRLTTVDKIVSALHLERVDFIKADIEGAEPHALIGAEETIRRFGPRMAFCVYHLADDPSVLRKIVKSIRPYLVVMNAAREQAFFWPREHAE